jgi:hypothetical protein
VEAEVEESVHGKDRRRLATRAKRGGAKKGNGTMIYVID